MTNLVLTPLQIEILEQVAERQMRDGGQAAQQRAIQLKLQKKGHSPDAIQAALNGLFPLCLAYAEGGIVLAPHALPRTRFTSKAIPIFERLLYFYRERGEDHNFRVFSMLDLRAPRRDAYSAAPEGSFRRHPMGCSDVTRIGA